jgi:isoleucyl-tRNA synthetase
VTHTFPSPEALGELAHRRPAVFAMPASRRRTLAALAGAVAGGELSIGPGAEPEEVRAALLALDTEAAASLLLSGKPLTVRIEETDIEVLPGEVEVRMTAREGFAVASEEGDLAALATDLTPALVREGMAREFVRRVQELRKTADLKISDRITVFYTATPKLAEAVRHHAEYISAETLALELREGPAPKDAPAAEDEFDGERLTVALVRAEK